MEKLINVHQGERLVLERNGLQNMESRLCLVMVESQLVVSGLMRLM